MIAREARARLAIATPKQSAGGGIAPRVVLEGEGNQFDHVSADGTVSVGMQGAGQFRVLTLWNLATGQARPLASPGPGETLLNAKIAPNGRDVAYRWLRAAGKPSSGFRVVSTVTGEIRDVPLVSSDDWGLCAWSADGRSLLIARFGTVAVRSLDWVSIADGRLTELKVFDEWMRAFPYADVSADGAFVTYSIAPRPGSNDRHIFVIDADGDATRRRSSTVLVSICIRSGRLRAAT